MPVWGYSGNPQRMQANFFASLENLCAYYDLPVPAPAGTGFPQNIYRAWQDIDRQLRLKNTNLLSMVVQDKGKPCVLAVAETYGLGYDLYYIPVRAYWKWSQSPEYTRITELLTVIFAYLHQVAGIPFYSDNGTYINSQYDTLYNWVMDGDLDEDNKEEMEYHQLQENTLYELMQAGAHILRDISDPAQLLKMEQVVRGFQHKDEAELELEFLGLEFLVLYQQYPKLSLMDCTRPDMVYPDEHDRISADMYTGFYWSARDCFADEIDSMISNHFNETPVMDEPAVIRTFEAMPDAGANELDFAKKLFGMMETLKDILIKYDHDNGSIPPEN